MKTFLVLFTLAITLANAPASRTSQNVETARTFTVDGLFIGMTEQQALKAMPILDATRHRPQDDARGIRVFFVYHAPRVGDVRICFLHGRTYWIVVDFAPSVVFDAGGLQVMRAKLEKKLGKPEPPQGKGSAEQPNWYFPEIDRRLDFVHYGVGDKII